MMASFERNPKFYAELKEMNEEILRVVEANNNKSHYFDFSDTFQDYIKQIEKLRKDYPVNSHEELTSNTATQNNISALNGNTSNNTTTTTNNNLGHNQSLFCSSLASSSTITSTTQFNSANSTFSTSQNHNNADNDNKTGADGDGEGDDDGDDAVPQPSIDLYEEPNYKYKTRCKLYERVIGGGTQAQLLGCGELYIKDLDTPGKLHLIVRRDPDLRTIILNQVITSSTPLKTIPKAVQIIVPVAGGKSTCYIAKVRDEQAGTELYEKLKEVKNI